MKNQIWLYDSILGLHRWNENNGFMFDDGIIQTTPHNWFNYGYDDYYRSRTACEITAEKFEQIKANCRATKIPATTSLWVDGFMFRPSEIPNSSNQALTTFQKPSNQP